eukprot:UN15345
MRNKVLKLNFGKSVPRKVRTLKKIVDQISRPSI